MNDDGGDDDNNCMRVIEIWSKITIFWPEDTLKTVHIINQNK